MKVLSLLQPWASLVVMGHKRIETRSWNTNFRGEILIHASMGKKKEAIQLFNDSKQSFLYHSEFRGVAFHDLPFGAIIGKVNLIHTIPTDQVELGTGISVAESKEQRKDWNFTNQELAFGDYSPGRFGWLLSDRVAFNVPIPAKGQLGLWEYDIESRIKAAEELEREGYL